MSEGLKDFLVQHTHKQTQVAAGDSYQAKLVAKMYWKLTSTCNMEVFKCTPEGRATGGIISEGE